MKKLLLIFLLLPLISFSQSAIIKNLFPVVKHRHSFDTIKSICFPVIYATDGKPEKNINSLIYDKVFGMQKRDSAQSAQTLLNALYAKYKGFGLYYDLSFNKIGFLSIAIHMVTYREDGSVPIYLNFDLISRKQITLKDLLNNKNDSISMRQAIVPPIIDSIRNFEQSINKNNPKYSDIVERLNSGLGTFSHYYMYDFIMTDKDLIFCFNCSLPSNLMKYTHTYKAIFAYKTLKNVFKPGVAKRLQ